MFKKRKPERDPCSECGDTAAPKRLPSRSINGLMDRSALRLESNASRPNTWSTLNVLPFRKQTTDFVLTGHRTGSSTSLSATTIPRSGLRMPQQHSLLCYCWEIFWLHCCAQCSNKLSKQRSDIKPSAMQARGC